MFFKRRFLSLQQITFADVATHNYFVRCQGRNLFNVHAPIMILPPDATDDDHLALIGLLNNSTGCFWIKQVFQDKGNGGIGGGIGDEKRERRYELAGSSLKAFPIPESKPLGLARQLDSLASQRGDLLPETIIASDIPTAERLTESRTRVILILNQMIAIQEELDWECYKHYALLTDDLCYTGDDLPELSLGQRAFEIVMGRQMNKGDLQTTWFERHGSTPITEIPKHWPAAYCMLVERRIKLIETNKEIGLMEKPEYKRRWNTEPWAEQQQRALKTWRSTDSKANATGRTWRCNRQPDSPTVPAPTPSSCRWRLCTGTDLTSMCLPWWPSWSKASPSRSCRSCGTKPRTCESESSGNGPGISNGRKTPGKMSATFRCHPSTPLRTS